MGAASIPETAIGRLSRLKPAFWASLTLPILLEARLERSLLMAFWLLSCSCWSGDNVTVRVNEGTSIPPILKPEALDCCGWLLEGPKLSTALLGSKDGDRPLSPIAKLEPPPLPIP